MESLWIRLKDRKLVQWALAYLAGAWLLLQVTDILGDQFAWPGALLRSITVLLAVGFLAALVLAWYHGEKGQQRVTGMEVLMLAGILVLAGVAVAWVQGGTELSGADAGSVPGPFARSAAAETDERSVAVLPFVNMSGDLAQEYFSDGITEEILNALSQVPEIRVPARTSSFFFKGKNLPVQEIARRLSVAVVLEGSVRKAGNRVRITAQLIDAHHDRRLWSQTFDRELEDIFAIQSEIARTVTEALRVRLGSGESVAVARPTESLSAYDLYLQGLYQYNLRTVESLYSAIALFEQAAASDPGFAHAYVGIARVYGALPIYADVPVRETRVHIEEAVRRALALDSTLSEAHVALGVSYLQTGEWAGTERELRRALALNPTTAHGTYGIYLDIVGRSDDALREVSRAKELNPLSLGTNLNYAYTLGTAGRYEEAIAHHRHLLELSPTYAMGVRGLAINLSHAGRQQEAAATAERLLALPGERSALELSGAGYVFARTGRTDRAREVLRTLESRKAPAIAFAAVHVGLGDHQRAIALLDEAIDRWELNEFWIREIVREAMFAPIRTHPRWPTLVRRLGLE